MPLIYSMKKGFILLILVLFLLPNAFATIQINQITPTTYNLGDRISFGGFVSRESSFKGIFSVNLICKDSRIPFMSRTVNLYANQKYNFKEEFTVPNILVGKCNLKSTLEENNSIIEDKLSEDIEITKELKGNFVLVNSKVQLGDNLDVSGDVFKLNGKRIDGISNIYFKKDSKILFIDTTDIKDGHFTFTIPSNYSSIGSYAIDFTVRDVNGNENSFVDSIKFAITDLLNLDLRTSKEKINPGSSFEVTGIVRDVYGKSVNSGSYIIKFDGKEYKGNILSGEIAYKIDLDINVKTGFHSVIVDVYDSSGNKGTVPLSINVLPKADSVDINLEKDSYKPGDKLKLKAFVYDQGKDIVDREIKIELRDPRDEKKFEKVIKNDFEFDIPLIAKSGEWLVRAISGDLKGEKKLYISEVKNLAYNIEGQTLVITNNGNVRVDETIIVRLDGVSESSTVTKKIQLDPGESISFDLGKEVKTGIYKVLINGKLFDNVKIEGRGGVSIDKNSNFLIVAVVLVILGILVLLKKHKFNFKNIFKFNFKKKERNVESYVSDLKKVVYDKFEQKENMLKKELQNFKIKPERSYRDYIEIKPKKVDLDSFRKSSSYLKRRQKEKDSEFKDGMFNMFK